MRSVRRENTTAELVVRRLAHAMGARYRLHDKRLPGSPDIVLASRRLCIFVHGCFWHRHEFCKLASTPTSNSEFWQEKFRRNIERDARNVSELRKLGWHVEIVWECETRKPDELKARLATILFKNRTR